MLSVILGVLPYVSLLSVECGMAIICIYSLLAISSIFEYSISDVFDITVSPINSIIFVMLGLYYSSILYMGISVILTIYSAINMYLYFKRETHMLNNN